MILNFKKMKNKIFKNQNSTILIMTQNIYAYLSMCSDSN